MKVGNEEVGEGKTSRRGRREAAGQRVATTSGREPTEMEGAAQGEKVHLKTHTGEKSIM